jgi:hypothetical protein
MIDYPGIVDWYEMKGRAILLPFQDLTTLNTFRCNCQGIDSSTLRLLCSTLFLQGVVENLVLSPQRDCRDSDVSLPMVATTSAKKTPVEQGALKKGYRHT